MSHNFYILLHSGAILSLAVLMGALWGLYTNPKPHRGSRILLLSLHGLIMFLILLAGFGLIARLQLPQPWPLWIYIKLLIWLSLALAPLLLKKAGKHLKNPKIYFLLLLFVWALLLTALLFGKMKWV